MPDTKGDQGAKAEEGESRAAEADRSAQEDGKWHMVSRAPHDTGAPTAPEDESAPETPPPAESEGTEEPETPETPEVQPGQQADPPVERADPEQTADVPSDDGKWHMVSRPPHDTGAATASEAASAHDGAPPAEQSSERPEVVEGEPAPETPPSAESEGTEEPETPPPAESEPETAPPAETERSQQPAAPPPAEGERRAEADSSGQEDAKWHMVSRPPHDTGTATAPKGESAPETTAPSASDRSEQPEAPEKQPGQQADPPVESAEPEQSADVASDDESGHERADGGASATGRSGGTESSREGRGEAKPAQASTAGRGEAKREQASTQRGGEAKGKQASTRARGEAKREQAPAGPGAAARALALVGRIIAGVFALLAAIIVLAILLKVTEANRLNPIVSSLLLAADFLVGPFDQIFQLDGRNAEVAVNWGIAAALYLVVGQVAGRALGAVGRRPAS